MSLVEQIRQHNPRYAATFDRSRLALPPARRWAILACMDARMTVEDIVGLVTGDAHIIRNAGGLATDDAIRSLVISTHLLGTREIAIIQHTGCGMLTFDDEAARRDISRATGADTSHLRLLAFPDVEASLREQVRTVAGSPLLTRDIPVTGFVYDVERGLLREIAEGRTGAAVAA